MEANTEQRASGLLSRPWQPQLIKNLPNIITFFRLALVPVFVVLMQDPSRWMVYAAIFVFIVAALTDSIDGLLARRFGAVTDLGKLLDPLVDKVLVMAALVMLIAQRGDIDGSPWVPAWMVILVLARELWVTGLRGVAASRGIIVAANASGKVKSLLQMVAIVFLLLHDLKFMLFGIPMTAMFVGLNLLFLSILFSVWGAVEYTQAVLIESRDSRQS